MIFSALYYCCFIKCKTAHSSPFLLLELLTNTKFLIHVVRVWRPFQQNRKG